MLEAAGDDPELSLVTWHVASGSTPVFILLCLDGFRHLKQ